MAELSDTDWADVAGDLRDRIDDVHAAVKIIDFLLSYWWAIMLVVAVLVLWPRRKSS